MKASIELEHKTLCESLNNASQMYYNGEPIVSDRVWDAMYDRLIQMEYEWKDLCGKHDSPTCRVYVDDEVRMRTYHMKTIYKTTRVSKMQEWIKAICKEYSGAMFTVEPKVDGIHVLLKYGKNLKNDQGHLYEILTRSGNVVTRYAMANSYLKEYESYNTAQNAELFVKKDALKAINEERVSYNKSEYKDCRSAASGIAQGRCVYVVHTLDCWGHDNPDLNTVPDFRPECDLINFEDKIEEVKNWADENNIPTDGVVVKVLQKEIRSKMGENDFAPWWAFALKWTTETKIVKITSIERRFCVQANRNIETIYFDPVKLEGREIKKVVYYPKNGDKKYVEGNYMLITLKSGTCPQAVDNLGYYLTKEEEDKNNAE